MKHGRWRTIWVVVSLCVFGRMAFAQNEPSVEPLAPPIAAPVPPPAYPPAYYPPAPRGPARLRYEEGDPIPAGYHVVQRSRPGLVIAGTIVFAVSYGIALTVALVDDFKDQTGSLAIPVAGPWLMMYSRSRPSCDSQTGAGCIEETAETILRFYLAVDGVAQAVGVGLLSFGVAGRQILVRDDTYASVHLAPGPIGRSGYGALLSGRF